MFINYLVRYSAHTITLNSFILFSFSVTVYIQYYFAVVSSVQHSGQIVIDFTMCENQLISHPMHLGLIEANLIIVVRRTFLRRKPPKELGKSTLKTRKHHVNMNECCHQRSGIQFFWQVPLSPTRDRNVLATFSCPHHTFLVCCSRWHFHFC